MGMRAAAGLLIALAVALGHVEQAAAKTQSWVITGGDLGEYAMAFWEPWDQEDWEAWSGLPGKDATALHVPSSPEGPAYGIYDSCGYLDCVSVQVVSGGPRYTYYPDSGLFYRRQDLQVEAGWFRLDERTAGFLDQTIATALAERDAGTLERDPVRAHYRQLKLEKTTLTFSPRLLPGMSAPKRNVFIIGEPESLPFIFGPLADTLMRPPAGVSAGPVDFRISLRVDMPGGWWGGPMGGYALPTDGDPGRLWMEEPWAGKPNPYYATTPEFDAAIVAAHERGLRNADAEPSPAAVLGTSPPGDVNADALTEEATEATRPQRGAPWSVLAVPAGAVVVAAGASCWWIRRRRSHGNDAMRPA